MSVLSNETGSLVETGYATLPRVNLLPPEIGEARRFRQIQYGLFAGLAASAGVVALMYVSALGSVGDATTELDAAAAEHTQLQTVAAEYADVTAVYARAAAAQAMLTEAMGEEVRYSEFLSDLSLSVPENVWLRSLTFSQSPPPAALGETEPGVGALTVSGVGFSHEDVAVWLESLAGQPGYTNPSFSSSTESLIGERTVVDFTSTATLTPEAYSREYTKPAGG
jgi:Tfp pilus assembly protein PilN